MQSDDMQEHDKIKLSQRAKGHNTAWNQKIDRLSGWSEREQQLIEDIIRSIPGNSSEDHHRRQVWQKKKKPKIFSLPDFFRHDRHSLQSWSVTDILFMDSLSKTVRSAMTTSCISVLHTLDPAPAIPAAKVSRGMLPLPDTRLCTYPHAGSKKGISLGSGNQTNSQQQSHSHPLSPISPRRCQCMQCPLPCRWTAFLIKVDKKST
jgi:hypothetical protein